MRNKHLEDANRVFFEGAKGGLRATDRVYDLLIQQDCKAGDHSNALEIAYEMEAAGRMATTFHFNCLLSVQVILPFMPFMALLMRTLVDCSALFSHVLHKQSFCFFQFPINYKNSFRLFHFLPSYYTL